MITLRRLRTLVLSSLPGFSSALKFYELLPSHGSYHPRSRQARRRCSTGVLLVLFTPWLVIVGFIVASWIPPSYQDIRRYERNLPQHSVGIGERRRYLRFPDHIWGHGLNNILQEAILTSYLSLLANRSYVFEDYSWSHLPFPYTLDNFGLRPTHIPMNAFISGPTAGGPLPQSDTTYRAVSAEHYDCVCPSDHPGKVIIDARTVGSPSRAGGRELVRWWVDKIDKVAGDAECVEIREGDVVGRVFDSYFFGIPSQFLPLLPDLFASPILHSFSWSPLILSAIVRNFNIFEMGSVEPFIFPAPPQPHLPLPSYRSNSAITGLLAVHLRRGDYERHCLRLADWRSTWMGVNRLEGLLDQFEDGMPRRDVGSIASATTRATEKLNQKTENDTHAAAVKAYYLSRCLPSVDQVVKRLRDVKRQWESEGGSNSRPSYFPARKLDKIYLLTNAASSYIAELEQALIKDGWGGSSGRTVLISTRDMQERLDAEQKYVSVGVDMAIAERAEVFLGNGFSSLSSNIVMLRMARGLDITSNRLL
ncbi:hypothetical protein K443DRAFT_684529 [Laccaria amethystina LaAM-08-1]|uniref:Uncharacterized protein n=1 Tax=Laccaria amethystina LaAM-08-1 TaxID=1095629 RepID=A0A0C9WXD9_9AGAR|nr:hypothetical protein K443DRAFT_684529 [Laccaria amethystina LaAM-08-1]